jgi:CRP-like cAMP-binding protein
LHKVPFFSGLQEYASILICAQLKHMMEPMAVIDHETGERQHIFLAGQQGAEFYVVLEGSVLISEGGGGSDTPKALGAAKAGDVFGELGVLLPPELRVPRMRSAYAEVSTSMASLSYFDLRALRMEEPGAPPIGAKATAQSTCTAPVSKGAAAD